MKIRALLLGLSVAIGVCGCMRATFVQTDTFKPGPPSALEWYIDKVPKKPYRAVGIIEVTLADTAALMEVVKAAYKKGQEVGCHLIIERSLHVVSPSALLPTSKISVCVADAVSECQYHTRSQPVYGGSAPASGTREFVCGVY